MSNKSAKWRERQKAYTEGRLHEWHEAQPAPPPQPPVARAHAAPDFSVRTIETTEWREGDRYPRFLLATNTGSNRPTPPRN